MKTPQEIQNLAGEIAHLDFCRRLELHPLPSGVCFLRVTIGLRNFVLEYHPTDGTGVSENFHDTPLFVGHDAAFDSLDEAIGRFKSFLDDAARTEANYEPQEFVLREDVLPWNKKI